MQGNDPWLRLLYTNWELIRSSRVHAAGNEHNVLSVVTYQSFSSHLKVYPDQHMRVYTRAVWQLDLGLVAW